MLGPKNVTIHGDIHTKITYIGLERDRYGKTLLKFSVENKTDAVSYTHLDVYKRQAHQGKGTRAFEQRLVYVHEGRSRVGKDRYELIGKKYFTFEPGTKTEYIWNTIWQYLDDTYELAETEHIFILGDVDGVLVLPVAE